MQSKPPSPQSNSSSIEASSLLAGTDPSLDLICFSHLRWHFVTQRPQHLLSRCAFERRVFFWEEPIFDSSPAATAWLELLQEEKTLWVLRPHLPAGTDADAAQREMLQNFLAEHKVEHFVGWYYTPMALAFTDRIQPDVTVYDCMDELSGFQGAPPELKAREQELFQKADVVFTGGMSLFESKRRQHRNVHAFPSSIDVAHFQSGAGTVDPTDQAAIPHPRAGFYGVLDERFDHRLMSAVARLRPEIHFILIGPVVKIDPAVLPQGANVHYLGAKSYAELPRYLAHWDAAMLPFAMNESTRFISPTKTPEYLAAGKRVVSTPIHDVVRGYGDEGLVAIADTPASFALAIDAALTKPTESWKKSVQVKLAKNSWDRTWAAMWAEIEKVRPRKSAPSRIHVSSLPLTSDRFPSTTAASSRANTSDLLDRFQTRANPLEDAEDADLTDSDIHDSDIHDSDLTDAHLSGSGSPTILSADLLTANGTSRPLRSERYDYLVVGAGFAGAVLAERLASVMGKRVLIIDKRDHVGGNTYDFHDDAGILIHKYGPHIFHTNSTEVVDYLSRFTAWRPYEHRVLASVDGHLLPIPINLDTINQLYGLSLDAQGMKDFLAARVETPELIRTSEDIVVSRLGRELYEKFFRNYTRKQWGLDPSELDSSVAGRIPVRYDRDDRYFTDTFQAMPRDGFTRLFERMLDHKNITVQTSVNYADVVKTYPVAKKIFTGPVDEYFSYKFGPLPYRSLEFKHQNFDREIYQSAAVVNYPNDHPYTRVTEFKYLTGEVARNTSVVFEYPRAEGDPYYPIPRPENAAIYAKYKNLADRTEDVHFVGRLATYRYYNMDQVVAQSLTTFRRILASAGSVRLPIESTGKELVGLH